MDELTAILTRIILEPDEDLHRLVYADRLEERGGPGDAARAKFVRGSIENKGRGFECYSHPQYYDVGFDAWGAGVNTDFNEYDRGFISDWITDAATFLRRADELLWHPTQNRPCPPAAQPIRRVVLTTEIACDEDFVGVPDSDGCEHSWLGGRNVILNYDELGRGMIPVLNKLWPGVEFVLSVVGAA